MKLKIKIMMGVLAAFAASVHAEMLDLAGADREVKNVSELAAYDGVTNSSEGDPVTLTFTNVTDMVYAGTISGNIKVAKKGVGMLTLSGDNTYTGGTVIGEYNEETKKYTVGGRLRANSLTAFGATSGAITVNCNCQQSSMASNKVTCVVFNAAGTFAYPINTSAWPTPGAGPLGSGGQRQYNVAVTVVGVTLSGKITGGGLSVHSGGLNWAAKATQVNGTTTISGEIYCPGGTCHFGSNAKTISITGKVTTLGVYQTTGSNWPPLWTLSNKNNSIGVIDVGGGSSKDYYLTASAANALGGAMVYSTNAISKSCSVRISASQTVESFSKLPSLKYAGGSLAANVGRHYIYATKTATVTMHGTNNRTNDWFLKDGGTSKKMSLVWDPTGDYTYTCVGYTNTINGTITVNRGTFEVGDSCSFPNVSTITVKDGATLKVSSAVDVPYSNIVLTSGATLHLDHDISAVSVKVGSKYLMAKDYSAGTYEGVTISGTGKVFVSTDPSGGGEKTYTWTGGGADNNITTAGNWQDGNKPDFDTEMPHIIFAGGTSAVLDRDIDAVGITFGAGVTGFDLSATGNHFISIGAGGITNAPAASARSVMVSAPVMPKAHQVWQMEPNTTFTLSGILKRYSTSKPTITVRQGSDADPTINFVGAATAEGASDFFGDFVFEETAVPGSKFGTAHVRASGYEPFGPIGTLKLRGRGAGHSTTVARDAMLFMSNAVISKAVQCGECYAACYCAVDNTTNVMNGAFSVSSENATTGAFPPDFRVGTNAVLRIRGNMGLGTRNDSDDAAVMLSSSASAGSDMSTGKIVFDGRFTRVTRGVKMVDPICVELNAEKNSITNNLWLSDGEFRFGTSHALSNVQVKVAFPQSGAADFNLNGTMQLIRGFASGMGGANRISSSGGSGTLRISPPSDVEFGGYVATNVTIQMEGAATLTFANATAFRAGSALAVKNGTVAVSYATALNEDVTLKLLGGTISIPAGQTALVGDTFYLDGNGALKPLKRGTYGPGDSKVGAFFASGSGSIIVKKGPSQGFMAYCH